MTGPSGIGGAQLVSAIVAVAMEARIMPVRMGGMFFSESFLSFNTSM